MSEQLRLLVEKYQCPGCCAGTSTSDKCYKPCTEGEDRSCQNHGAGTIIPGIGPVNLGLPLGFDTVGPIDKSIQKTIICIFPDLPKIFPYNALNVPVWALEHEGNLVIRRYSPRINKTFIDIIPNKRISDLPEPFHETCINVSKVDMGNGFWDRGA